MLFKNLVVKICIFSFISFAGWSEPLYVKDLLFKDNMYYELVPFTGEITGTINGKINSRDKKLIINGVIEKGIQKGQWTTFHDNGNVESIGFYNENGKKDGNWTYNHSDGKLRSNGLYRNGEKNGLWVSMHSNGQIEYKEDFFEGIPKDKKIEIYDKNGSHVQNLIYEYSYPSEYV